MKRKKSDKIYIFILDKCVLSFFFSSSNFSFYPVPAMILTEEERLVRLGLRLREREVELSKMSEELEARETERFKQALEAADVGRLESENEALRSRVAELEVRIETERDQASERCRNLE